MVLTKPAIYHRHRQTVSAQCESQGESCKDSCGFLPAWHEESTHRTGTRAGPRCHTPLPAPPTANGSRTPFSSRHPSSRRSPLSSRCMCMGNRHRCSRTPRHLADGKRFVYFMYFISFLFFFFGSPMNSDANLEPHSEVKSPDFLFDTP
jgi:hypothetical protein